MNKNWIYFLKISLPNYFKQIIWVTLMVFWGSNLLLQSIKHVWSFSWGLRFNFIFIVHFLIFIFFLIIISFWLNFFFIIFMIPVFPFFNKKEQFSAHDADQDRVIDKVAVIFIIWIFWNLFDELVKQTTHLSFSIVLYRLLIVLRIIDDRLWHLNWLFYSFLYFIFPFRAILCGKIKLY